MSSEFDDDLSEVSQTPLVAGADAAPLAPNEVAFVCPQCGAQYSEVVEGRIACASCPWTGEVTIFDPLPMEVTEATAALPESATCIHHPAKLATAICAGTGDFICELCRVDLKGQNYSVQYLESGGKEKIEESYRKTLPRPDRGAINYLALCFVPYVNFLFFLWLPLAFVQYFKIFPLRRRDELFRRFVSPGRVAAIGIILFLLGSIFVIGIGSLIWFAVESIRDTEIQGHFNEGSFEQSYEE